MSLSQPTNVCVDSVPPSPPRVLICGGTGQLAGRIATLIGEDPEVELGSIGEDMVFTVNSNTVLVDISTPTVTTSLLTKLLMFPEGRRYPPLVIGTTGDLPVELIRQYSKLAPVVVCSNFSYGAPELYRIIRSMSYQHWDNITVSESWSDGVKYTTPSETVRCLCSQFPSEVGSAIKIEPQVIGGKFHHQYSIKFETEDEELILTHRVKSDDVFANGAIRYVNWIKTQKPGVYQELDYMEVHPLTSLVTGTPFLTYQEPDSTVEIPEFDLNKPVETEETIEAVAH